MAESACNESWALGDAESLKHQDLEEILAEVQRCLKDHSSLLHSFYEMICCDVLILHQSASLIVLYLDRRLSSSAALSNSGSTTSNPVCPGGLSLA